jgi:hypothetical protein
MADLENKYLFLEVTKSPPCATLCGPKKIIDKIDDAFDCGFPKGVNYEVSELGNVMEIRLSGEEGNHNSTFFKMALLHEALKVKYEPMTLDPANDSVILTPIANVD